MNSPAQSDEVVEIFFSLIVIGIIISALSNIYLNLDLTNALKGLIELGIYVVIALVLGSALLDAFDG